VGDPVKNTALLLLTTALAGFSVSASAVRAGCCGDSVAARPKLGLNGFVSTSWNLNLNDPRSRTNGFRAFDSSEGSFQIDVVEIVAQINPATPKETGFRVDLTAGSAIPRVTASQGFFRDDSNRAGDIDVHQAYLSYVAPLGRGLRIDIGKHVTHMGYEVIEGYDGADDNASRSLLFTYAIPFTQTGVRCTYPFSSHAAAALFLVNGWDNVRDNNRAKSFGTQISISPSASINAAFNYLGGAEQPDNTKNLRHTFDFTGLAGPVDRLTLGFNLDYGMEKGATATGGDAIWRGAALYARSAISKVFTVTARAEAFDDPDGFRTGTVQTLKEVTLTPDLRLSDALRIRSDLRVDRSDHAVFEGGRRQGADRTQPTISLNAIFVF
jgi:hypothetical protein